MAKYPISIATFPSVGTRTIFGTALVNRWVTELIAFQRDYVSTIGGFGTLASFVNTARNPDGSFKLYAGSHSMIASVTASLHHNKIHGTTHQASDPVVLGYANVSRKGLMSKDQANIVNTAATNAKNNHILNGHDYASGFATVALSFNPIYVQLMFTNGMGTYWRYVNDLIELDHLSDEHWVSSRASLWFYAASMPANGLAIGEPT